MTTWERYVEARCLQAAKIRIKKRTEKERELFSEIGKKNMLKVLTGEA